MYVIIAWMILKAILDTNLQPDEEMSSFLRHDPCPSCHSKDNLGVWDDGHKWCFGCGYYEKGSRPITSLKEAKSTQKQLTLPQDSSGALSTEAVDWLNKYGITHSERFMHGIVWSFYEDLLIFPFYDKDKRLMAWQGRYFGENKKHPKYLTYGVKNSFY